MSELRVLDLSKNHLNVFALSKINIGPLPAVESLDLSGNGLYTGMSDYFLADSPSLANLSLNGNSITKIAQNTFSGSLALKKINLHNNVILEIEDGAFDSLQHLTELDLSKNSITCITDFNLYHLKVLNLSKNSMELFQSVISEKSYKLLSLDLSENKMPCFPVLPKNNVLHFLDVSRNQLQSFSDCPEKNVSLNKLIYLDMSYNQITNISESFFSIMESLEVLNLSKNCIGSFSITTGSVLPSVKIINLSYNSLQSLTIEENSLQSLETLFLQGNDLTVLDHQIFQRLSNIRYLHLQKNNLKICAPKPELTVQNHREPPSCVSFFSVRNLQFLNLSENNLLTLPANAFAKTPLKSLDLSLNLGLDMNEDSLSGLQESLENLFLRENNISCLNTHLSTLRSLKHVDLSGNQLTSLPLWHKESHIESLNLQNNNLVSVGDSTISFHSLKTLYMGSNPLSCCKNLRFLHMLQNSAVVVPDIETVTCFHDDFSEPVNIEKVTEEMCHTASSQNYIIVALLTLLVIIVLALLVRCCRLRKRKRNRGYRA